jgi:hypothetical protein
VDLIVYNTKIYNLDSTKVIANSIAIKDKIITQIGTDLNQKLTSGELKDAQGKTLLPGFNDAHAHMIGAGLTMQKVDLSKCRTKNETLKVISDRVKKTKKGEWITGRGWNHEFWEDNSWPTASELDAITTEHPIYVRRVDGHSGWANSLALKLAGVTNDTKDPQGGAIRRDKKGIATGVVIDAAENIISNIIPEDSDDKLIKAVLDAQKHVLKRGITSITSIGNERNFEIFRTLLNENKLKVRVNFVPDYKDTLQNFTIEQPERLNVQFVKVYMDGSLGSRSAWLNHPYSDEPSTTGLPQFSDAELIHKINTIKSYNLEPMIHAIGDKGNQHLLEIYNEYIKTNKLVKSRFRIEHAQILNEKCYSLFSEGNIIASMQPKHCISDMLWAENRIGKERAKFAYPWKTIIDKKIKIAFGTDWPIEPVDPVFGIYGAVTRQFMEDSILNEGWIPEQKISVFEAIKAYTEGSAYSEYMEDEKGKIKVGQFADFILIDKNIFEINPIEIKTISVTDTYIGGVKVY